MIAGCTLYNDPCVYTVQCSLGVRCTMIPVCTLYNDPWVYTMFTKTYLLKTPILVSQGLTLDTHHLVVTVSLVCQFEFSLYPPPPYVLLNMFLHLR